MDTMTHLASSGFLAHNTVECFSPLGRETKTCEQMEIIKFWKKLCQIGFNLIFSSKKKKNVAKIHIMNTHTCKKIWIFFRIEMAILSYFLLLFNNLSCFMMCYETIFSRCISFIYIYMYISSDRIYFSFKT